MVAIAKGIITQSEHLLALIPTDNESLAETLFYRDEVQATPWELEKPEFSEQEITMTKTIISSMKETSEPSKYHDEYRERLWELIQTKTNNEEIPVTPDEQ